jgi:putative membrane protein
VKDDPGSEFVGEETPAKAPAQERAPDLVRDHLANKRTMLAWTRTGIAIIALGFVVSRFGLLLRGLEIKNVPQGVSTLFGVGLVAIGGILIILSSLEYLHTGRAIARGDYHWSPTLEIAMTMTLIVASVLLAIYLVLTG